MKWLFIFAVTCCLAGVNAQTYEAFQREVIIESEDESSVEVDFCKWHITSSHVIWESGDGHSADIHKVMDYLQSKEVYAINTYGNDFTLDIDQVEGTDLFYLKYKPKQDTSWHAIYHCIKRPE